MPDRLKEVEVPLVGHLTCRIEYFPYSITDGMICAGETMGIREWGCTNYVLVRKHNIGADL